MGVEVGNGVAVAVGVKVAFGGAGVSVALGAQEMSKAIRTKTTINFFVI
jgi:hypothetical protein